MTERDWKAPVISDDDDRTPAEVVAALSSAVIFPRFLGLDDGADYVWELEDGKWTWGVDPDEALAHSRTFLPEDYVIKFGAPTRLERR